MYVFLLVSPVKKAYTLIMKEYSQILNPQLESSCPESLEDYFKEEEKREKCFPPRSDYFTFSPYESGACEIFYLLLEEASISLNFPSLKKELPCLFH